MSYIYKQEFLTFSKNEARLNEDPPIGDIELLGFKAKYYPYFEQQLKEADPSLLLSYDVYQIPILHTSEILDANDTVVGEIPALDNGVRHSNIFAINFRNEGDNYKYDYMANDANFEIKGHGTNCAHQLNPDRPFFFKLFGHYFLPVVLYSSRLVVYFITEHIEKIHEIIDQPTAGVAVNDEIKYDKVFGCFYSLWCTAVPRKI